MNKFFVTLCLAVATTVTASPVLAQCAGCGADFNKAERERMAQEAKEAKEKADKEQLKASLGDGTAAGAAEAMQKHNEAIEKAAKPEK